MKYPTGEDVLLGDRVSLWGGAEGLVVCSLDTNEYSTDYPAGEWSYLKSGVLILSPQAGLIHYIEPEPSLKLLQRASALQAHFISFVMVVLGTTIHEFACKRRAWLTETHGWSDQVRP
jgi:hypothetical protein